MKAVHILSFVFLFSLCSLMVLGVPSARTIKGTVYTSQGGPQVAAGTIIAYILFAEITMSAF